MSGSAYRLVPFWTAALHLQLNLVHLTRTSQKQCFLCVNSLKMQKVKAVAISVVTSVRKRQRNVTYQMKKRWLLVKGQEERLKLRIQVVEQAGSASSRNRFSGLLRRRKNSRMSSLKSGVTENGSINETKLSQIHLLLSFWRHSS